MKTKIILLTSILFLSIAGVFAQYSGETGPLTWNLNVATATLTISGEGEMPNYDKYVNSYAPWYFAHEFFQTVVIESGVTNISNKAFYASSELISINIPNTVTKIGNKAFHFCLQLTSVEIPNGVTSIGDMAYYGCTELLSMSIPESVTTIGEEVFYYCNKLTAINVANDNSHYTSNDGVLFNKSKSALLCCPAGKKGVYVVPDNVTHIEMGAFLNCRNLTAISTPNSLKGIGNRAFYYCDSIVAINLSNGITSIGEEAFAYCTNLLSINIPNALTRISDHTFFLCNGLTSIVIPNNVFLIGAFAFYACANLTSITIPCSVKGFGFKSLAACYNLSEIINLNTEPVSINSCVFASDDLCMYIPADITLRVPNSAVDAYKIAYVWKVFNVEGGGILVNPIPNNTKYGYTKGDGLYELDTTATVTATALPGYQFVNWTKNGEEVSTDTSYTFTVAEDVELVAHFEDDGTGAGIVETRLTAPLQVYPNPTTGEIRIENYELGIEGVEVFDVYGRKQTSHHASPHTSHSSSLIDISHCSAGTYFLRITTKKGIVTKKIVKY